MEVLIARKSKIPKKFLLVLLIVILFSFILTGAFYFYRSQFITKPGSQKTNLVYAPSSFAVSTSFKSGLQQGPYLCPVSGSLCQKPDSFKDGIISINLTPNTPLLAAFDGTAQGLLSTHPQTEGTKEDYYLIMLTSQDKGLRAYYSFKGTVAGSKQVKAGDVLGISSGQVINFLGKSFFFELDKAEGKQLVPAALSNRDFKL